MADRLATPEDLAAVLQQDLDRSTAEILIECATAVVQESAGQRIVRAQSTITVEGTRDRWLHLPQLPVVSVDAVTMDGVALDDFALRGHQVFRPYGWHSLGVLFSTIDVTYTHGYAPGDPALEFARTVTLSLAAAVYTNPSGASSERLGDWAVSYGSASSQTVAQMETTPYLRTALLRQYGRGAGSISVGSFADFGHNH